MWKMIHQVLIAGIWTKDLFIVSLLELPLDKGSCPLTYTAA